MIKPHFHPISPHTNSKPQLRGNKSEYELYLPLEEEKHLDKGVEEVRNPSNVHARDDLTAREEDKGLWAGYGSPLCLGEIEIED